MAAVQKKTKTKSKAQGRSESSKGVRFGAVIREARKRQHLTQSGLSELLGVSRFTVRNWESDINKPDHEMIPKLCSALELPVQELFGIKSGYSSQERLLINNFRKLKSVSRHMAVRIISSMLDEEIKEKESVLKSTNRLIELLPGAVAAGEGFEFQNLPSRPFFIRTNDKNARADAVVKVSGKSMEPVYHDGDYLCLEYTAHARCGEDVVAGWREGAIVKRVASDGTLYSLNPDYPFKYDDGDEGVRLIGRVLCAVTSADIPSKEDEDLLCELFKDELQIFGD